MKNFIQNIINTQKSNALFLLEQAMVSGTNFIIAILLARFMGVENYGIFALCWMIILFFLSIQQAVIIAPLQSILPGLLGEKFLRMKSLILVSFLILVAFSFVLLIGFSMISSLIFPEWEIKEYLIPMLPLLITYLIWDYIRKDLFRNKKIIQALIMTIILSGIQFLGIIFLNYKNILSVNIWITLLSFAHLLAALPFIWKTIRTINYHSFQKADVIELWYFSRWLAGTSILQWFSGNLFIIAAAGIIGPVAVGAIRVIQNLFGLLGLLLQALENKIPVSASQIFGNNGLKPMLRFIIHVMKFITPVYLLIIGLLVVFNKQIINVLYGTEYTEFAWLIYPFSVVSLLILVGIPLRFILRTIKQTQHVFIAYILTTITGLILASPMVSQFDVLGVIAGLGLSQLITNIWFIYAIVSYIRKIRIETIQIS